MIRRLWTSDSIKLSRMLMEQPKEYVRYFHPFDFDTQSVLTVLRLVIRDVWMGFFLDQELVALLLLRGWDEGYKVPMYGICVDYRHAGKGWGRMSLALARTIATERGCLALRLKVHPDNHKARYLYEQSGFYRLTMLDPKGDLVYEAALA